MRNPLNVQKAGTATRLSDGVNFPTNTLNLVSLAPPAPTAAFRNWLHGEGWSTRIDIDVAPTLVFATEPTAVPAADLAARGDALLVIANESVHRVAGALVWPRDAAAIVDWLANTAYGAARRATSETLMAFSRTQLIGESPVFLAMMDRLCKVISVKAPVLLVGPTGTGKELLARAIHYCGDRSDKGFEAVNCGALPETVLESELFGHRRGAFTDARSDRLGLLAQAHGGTLFLDEIDALSPRGQVALLRFVQSGEYRPVGATKASFADARIVAASNADLGILVQERSFREDLYYRLAVLTIETPCLAERGDDVLLLARHFLAQAAVLHEKPVKRFSPRVLAAMLAYDWPGNIRELENYVHRACVMANGPEIGMMPGGTAPSPMRQPPALDRQERRSHRADAPTSRNVGGGFHAAKAAMISAFERDYIAAMLAATAGNVTRAALLAGLERRTFGRLVKRHGLRR